ncbi:hypothetical protein [Azospira inquinata]|uniref:DUF904 domain-containing protein n=1 Tax=Azospira inquinata TaxID=2785627 RepID=A0A975SKA8_9RHOO|nr:hypothetical protein [Azospira inquinata]QWT46816.1 hypothetical protein J8L76_03650 [Azospira inquinata]QWT47862.1 hypothetical protein Azoinq_08220 [Azospira inquinata]
MDTELNALETKVAQVVTLCQSLKTENQDLRQRLAAAEEEQQRLALRMDAARTRLETLIQQLPGEDKA